MFIRRAKQSTPASPPIGRPWTVSLFYQTFAGIRPHERADIYLHSLSICHNRVAATVTGQLLALPRYWPIAALQGITSRSQVFCDIDVYSGNTKTQVGTVKFDHRDNPAGGPNPIAVLRIALADRDGTLMSALRNAFSGAGKDGRIAARLDVSGLTWDAVSDGLPKGEARFDLDCFDFWEYWGAPIL